MLLTKLLYPFVNTTLRFAMNTAVFTVKHRGVYLDSSVRVKKNVTSCCESHVFDFGETSVSAKQIQYRLVSF